MFTFQAVLSYVKDGGFSRHYQSLQNKAFRTTIFLILGLGNTIQYFKYNTLGKPSKKSAEVWFLIKSFDSNVGGGGHHWTP